MRYLGGKFRIAGPLTEYLRERQGARVFAEPFCGGLHITRRVPGPRLAADASRPLIALYKAVRAGWDPPAEVTEEIYQAVSARRDPDDPLTGFVGYGCTFGGKYFGGYARSPGRVYAGEARRALLSDVAACADAHFVCASYSEWAFESGHLVYCDPPYRGTTGYAAVGAFDSDAFWTRAAEWTRAGAVVLVSEYTAPPEWDCVWSLETTASVRGARGCERRVERLFELDADARGYRRAP